MYDDYAAPYRSRLRAVTQHENRAGHQVRQGHCTDETCDWSLPGAPPPSDD